MLYVRWKVKILNSRQRYARREFYTNWTDGRQARQHTKYLQCYQVHIQTTLSMWSKRITFLIFICFILLHYVTGLFFAS